MAASVTPACFQARSCPNANNLTDGQSACSVTDNIDTAVKGETKDEKGGAISKLKRGHGDFIFQKIIGRGSISTVYIASDVHNKELFAIKAFTRASLQKKKKIEYVKREKEIQKLLTLKPRETAPFFVNLLLTFQDEIKLYFVFSFAPNGTLQDKMNKQMGVACARFYAAEILHALEHMHSLGIIHRDLKPRNILLNKKNHIQISGFSCAKLLKEEEPLKQKSISFYASPETLVEVSKYSRATDLWAFGAILFEMIAGSPAFEAKSKHSIFQKINSLNYEFPDGFCPPAKDLVQKLLVLEPTSRLGVQDGRTYASIRSHEFFSRICFEKLYKQSPPFEYCNPPGTSNVVKPEVKVPDRLKPRLGDKQAVFQKERPFVEKRKESKVNLWSLTPEELRWRLSEQKETSRRWYYLAHGNLVLKQGLVKKKSAFWSKKWMLLLTLGPHLYCANPNGTTLEGEIPFTSRLQAHAVDFKHFWLRTPEQDYFLKTPKGQALKWCKAINELWVYTYGGMENPEQDAKWVCRWDRTGTI